MNEKVIEIVVGIVLGVLTHFVRFRASGKSKDSERGIIAVANELEECQEQNKNLRELVAKYREVFNLDE